MLDGATHIPCVNTLTVVPVIDMFTQDDRFGAAYGLRLV
jgi:hypothetical protein